MRLHQLSAIVVVGALAMSCTSGRPKGAARPPVSPSPTRTSVTTPPSPPPHPVSLQALMQKRFDGTDLRVGRVLGRASRYTRYAVTFKSGGLTISGTMHVPRGAGPFPVLILNHGYRDVRTYVPGEGLRREQDFLASRGYVVLHVDFRNHAQSDDDPGYERTLRLGYTEDAVNAILAVEKSSLPYLDPERVGMLGRSMGGGVTLNAAVVRPDLIDAVVVYAPVSSNYVHNFNKWTRNGPHGAAIVASYGSPERNPQFWRNLSSVNFFERITMPVLIHHGTADDSTPIEWTRRTVAELQRLGKQVGLHVYRGEPHVFGAAWPLSIERTADFFDRYLKR